MKAKSLPGPHLMMLILSCHRPQPSSGDYRPVMSNFSRSGLLMGPPMNHTGHSLLLKSQSHLLQEVIKSMTSFLTISWNVAFNFSRKRTVQHSYDEQVLISLDFHLRQQKSNHFRMILPQMRIRGYLIDSLRVLVMAKEWHLTGSIFLATQTAMAFKQIDHDQLCGLGGIGLSSPLIRICHGIVLFSGN